jgi:predicted phage terminase large subunit-like protein
MSWKLVEPGIEFVDGEHIRVVCQHLQHWITHDEAAPDAMPDLLINIPPGHMKSLLCCVFAPTWSWGPAGMPWLRWMFASFSGELVVRDAIRRRDIVASEWFQTLWPMRFSQKRLLRFANEHGGWMYGTTCPKGQATGEHPDRLMVDDPHNTVKDTNVRDLESVRAWWGKAISTRGQTRQIRRCVIGQRVAYRDLAGMLIDSRQFAHICLPLRYNPAIQSKLGIKPTPLGFLDFRSRLGQLLWPEGVTERKIAEITQFMSAETEAAQLDQLPPQHGGGVRWPHDYFEGEDLWFDEWPADSQVQFTVVALDPSLGKTTKSDYQAWTVAKLHLDGTIYVDAVLTRVPPEEMAAVTLELSKEHKPGSVVVEGEGFQEVLEPYFQLLYKEQGTSLPITLVRHGGISKVNRILRTLSSALKRRLFRFRANSAGAALLFEQLETFQGVYDDGPDSLEMATRELRALWHGGAN